MKIIIAPDSFKGSLTAAEAAEAMAQGVLAALPTAEIEKIPMADGGEGTVAALVAATDGRLVEATATGPQGKPVKGFYGILGNGTTAVIEMAAVSGLTLVPKAQKNPLHTTTFGTGELIRQALDAGCREFIIGIGGSATNDGGSGMAQALGVRFYREKNAEITTHMCGGLLDQVARIDLDGCHPAIRDSLFTVACDVANPLLGPKGCAHVYGPQKGATPEIVKQLDQAMSRYIDVVEETVGFSVRAIPGSGAAGGLGAGLMAFLDAKLKPGIELVLSASHFAERIRDASLILTGEGKLDYQTAFGKTIAGITRLASVQGLPVLALAGSVESHPSLYEMGLTSYFSLCTGPMTLDQAVGDGARLLQDTAERVMRTAWLAKTPKR